jgi:hypothetical protein
VKGGKDCKMLDAIINSTDKTKNRFQLMLINHLA